MNPNISRSGHGMFFPMKQQIPSARKRPLFRVLPHWWTSTKISFWRAC